MPNKETCWKNKIINIILGNLLFVAPNKEINHWVCLFQVNKDDLKPTQQAIEKVHNICQGGKSVMELIAEINILYNCIR